MKSSIAIIIRWVFFGTSIIHGPAKGQVDHRIDQCPFELLVTFLLIQAERPARRGGAWGAKVWTFKKEAVFFGNHAPFSWVVGGGWWLQRPDATPTDHRARPDVPALRDLVVLVALDKLMWLRFWWS